MRRRRWAAIVLVFTLSALAVACTEQRSSDRCVRVGIATTTRDVDHGIPPRRRVDQVPERESKCDAYEARSAL